MNKLEKALAAALSSDIDTTVKDNMDIAKSMSVEIQNAGSARRPSRQELERYFKMVRMRELQIRFLAAIL